MKKHFFGIEKQTGLINGFYTHKNDCIESSKRLSKRWRGSSWAIGEIELFNQETNEEIYIGNDAKWHIHQQDNQKMLDDCFGNSDVKIKPMINDRKIGEPLSFRCGDEMVKTLWFNEKYNAFDVLVNYMFGGDREAALEHLDHISQEYRNR